MLGGEFTTATNSGGAAVTVNYIAQWNGGSWSTLGSGVNSDVEALAVSGNRLYAGGYFTTAGTNVSAYVAEAILGTTPPFIITTNSDFGFTNSHIFGFDVNAPGDAGQTLVILGSTNLANWVSVQSNVLSGSLFHFSDPGASNFTRRFYRAEVLP